MSLIPRAAAEASREPAPPSRVRQVLASLPSGAPTSSPTEGAPGVRASGGWESGAGLTGGRGRAVLGKTARPPRARVARSPFSRRYPFCVCAPPRFARPWGAGWLALARD